MKTSPLPESEMDSLRAEVRELRASIVELEDRLAEYEPEDENPWGIWPYCWVVAAWEFGQSNYSGVQTKLGKWRLGQHNRRHVRVAEQSFGELHLT